MFTKPSKRLFNDDWLFCAKELNSPFPGIETNQEWAEVEIPHDRLAFARRDSFKPQDCWYKKTFAVTAEEAKQSVQLAFDGIHAECSVYINNNLVLDDYDEARQGFTLEIARYLQAGDNTVHVGVRHAAKERTDSLSSLPSGAGIYRNVYLIKQNKTHIVADKRGGNGGGIRTTALLRSDAPWKVRVGVDCVGKFDFVRYTLTDSNGEQIGLAEASGDYMFVQETDCADKSATLASAAWTFHNPCLYTIKAQLVKSDKIIDEASDTFMFRTVDFNEDGVLLLNGCAVKLCGVRIGDNYGALGAAFNINAAKQQLRTLHNMGVNAIGGAAGCLAPEMYKLCDEMGLLILDEDRQQNFIAYDTLFDSAGAPKPLYYYYKALWQKRGGENEPFVKILPHWDWNVGQIVDVSVYSNMKKTELFFAGESLGRQITDWENDNVRCAMWQVKYECGELTARAYDNSGGIAAVDKVSSFWDACLLKADYDTDKVLRADGRDLLYIDITAYDEAGEFVANANNRVTVEVSGAARLVGFDNGDDYDYDNFKGNNRRLCGGRATAIIQTALEAGQAFVEVSSRGLKEILLDLDVVAVDESQLEGVSVTDNEQYYSLGYGDDNLRDYHDEVPARKVELIADKTILNENNLTAKIKAEIFPADSTYQSVTWMCVFDDEFDMDYDEVAHIIKVDGLGAWSQITLVPPEKPEEFAKAKAKLPPRCRICACCKANSGEMSQIISEIELSVRL
ncbi:MAG: DUF4982 domain-containing protein [Oscillospiraceae bacterium]|nr:DUF4982 domain-containing protein [Oscillospiraceae bacterium]